MSATGRISKDKVSPSRKSCSLPVSKRTRLCGKRRRMASAASAASEVAKAAARSFAAGAATKQCDQDSVSALMSSSPALTPPASTKPVRQISLAVIDKYEIQETRGRGNYGVVYKARNRVDNKIVAIKKTTVDCDGEGIPGTTLREVSLLKDLQHSNIVSILDVVPQRRNLYLVFDYMATDLQKFIKSNRSRDRGIDKKLAKAYLYQLVDALAYCHANRVLHRDLKPENLLIDNTGQLKVADFGLARAFALPASIYTHEVVTLWYRAPEILFGAAEYSAAVDMWSAGCIFVEMLAGKPLFPGTSELDQLLKIFRVLGTPNEKRWPGVSLLPDYQTLFPQWSPRKLDRLIAGLCYESCDITKRLLTYKPEERMKAREVLDHKFYWVDPDESKQDADDADDHLKKRFKPSTSPRTKDKCIVKIKSPLQDNLQKNV